MVLVRCGKSGKGDRSNIIRSLSNVRYWPKGEMRPSCNLNFCLLRKFQSVIHFDAKIANRAFQFCMTKQKLNST